MLDVTDGEGIDPLCISRLDFPCIQFENSLTGDIEIDNNIKSENSKYGMCLFAVEI